MSDQVIVPGIIVLTILASIVAATIKIELPLRLAVIMLICIGAALSILTVLKDKSSAQESGIAPRRTAMPPALTSYSPTTPPESSSVLSSPSPSPTPVITHSSTHPVLPPVTQPVSVPTQQISYVVSYSTLSGNPGDYRQVAGRLFHFVASADNGFQGFGYNSTTCSSITLSAGIPDVAAGRTTGGTLQLITTSGTDNLPVLPRKISTQTFGLPSDGAFSFGVAISGEAGIFWDASLRCSTPTGK